MRYELSILTLLAMSQTPTDDAAESTFEEQHS
jgi:hypothetical protein